MKSHILSNRMFWWLDLAIGCTYIFGILRKASREKNPLHCRYTVLWVIYSLPPKVAACWSWHQTLSVFRLGVEWTEWSILWITVYMRNQNIKRKKKNTGYLVWLMAAYQCIKFCSLVIHSCACSIIDLTRQQQYICFWFFSYQLYISYYFRCTCKVCYLFFSGESL